MQQLHAFIRSSPESGHTGSGFDFLDNKDSFCAATELPVKNSFDDLGAPLHHQLLLDFCHPPTLLPFFVLRFGERVVPVLPAQ